MSAWTIGFPVAAAPRVFLGSIEQLMSWERLSAMSTDDYNMVKGLWALGRLRLKGYRYQRFSLIDESLFALALLCATAERYLAQHRACCASSSLTLTSPSSFSRSW